MMPIPEQLALIDAHANSHTGMTVEDAVRVLVEAGIDTGEKYIAALMDPGNAAVTYALWTTSTAAAWCGIKPVTWRSYARRWPDGAAGFPQAVGRAVGGELLYRSADVRRWHQHRPGPGRRSDLTE